MVRKSKLLAALDAHRGRDIEAEKRQKQVKAAEKRKREKAAPKAKETANSDEEPAQGAKVPDAAQGDFATFSDRDDRAEETRVPKPTANINRAQPEDKGNSDVEEEEELDEDSDVALSNLSASERDDTISHQRLTINNGPALLASQSRIALLRKQPKNTKIPFHIHNSLVLRPAHRQCRNPRPE